MSAKTPLSVDGIDHVGVVVRSLDAVSMLLENVLGLVPSLELERPDMRARFFDCQGVSIEAIEPIDAESRAQRLGHATARIEHVAFKVADLDRAAHALARLGIPTTMPQSSAGGRRTFWADESATLGVRCQFVETQGSDTGSAMSEA
jgi:catechol 2,3-dioxygenase-like lactoylglutathione lyase family enzyme